MSEETDNKWHDAFLFHRNDDVMVLAFNEHKYDGNPAFVGVTHIRYNWNHGQPIMVDKDSGETAHILDLQKND